MALNTHKGNRTVQIWEKLEGDHPLGNELNGNVQSQTTYAEFHRESEQDDWEVRVIKQKVWIAEVEYMLKEIYGEIVEGVADDGDPGEVGDGSGNRTRIGTRSRVNSSSHPIPRWHCLNSLRRLPQ